MRRAETSPRPRRGGLYLWCRLPEGFDAGAFARAALRENIVLAPGNSFSPARSAAGLMRFNVSQMSAPIWADLARILHDLPKIAG